MTNSNQTPEKPWLSPKAQFIIVSTIGAVGVIMTFLSWTIMQDWLKATWPKFAAYVLEPTTAPSIELLGVYVLFFVAGWGGGALIRSAGRVAPEVSQPPTSAPKAFPVLDPTRLTIIERDVLLYMANAIHTVLAESIANKEQIPRIDVEGALLRFQDHGLVESGIKFWNLTQAGIRYVQENRKFWK